MKVPLLLRVVALLLLPAFLLSYASVTFFIDERVTEINLKEFHYWEKHDRSKALLICDALLEKDPADPDLHYEMIHLYGKLDANELKINKLILDNYPGYPEKYYSSLISSSDQQVVDIGRLGKAIAILESRPSSTDEAKEYLDAVKNRNLFHLNEMYARTVLQDEAISFLKKETELNPHNAKAFDKLLGLLCIKNPDEADLYLQIADNTRTHINPAIRIYIYSHYGLLSWSRLIDHIFIRQWSAPGTAGSLLIFLVWMIFLFSMNIFNEKVISGTFFIFLSAIVIMPVTFFLYRLVEDHFTFPENIFLENILSTGFIEEFIKILPVVLYILIRPEERKSPFKIFFFGAVSALTFSFLENILYFNEYHDINIISRRSLIVVCMHMLATGIISYGLILFINRKKSFFWIPATFLIAACLHGTYNSMLAAGYFPISYMLVLSGCFAWSIMLNNTINISPCFAENHSHNSIKGSLYLITGLSLVLLTEFFMNTVLYGKMRGIHVFENSVTEESVLIPVFALLLSRFEVVKGKWESLKIFSIKKIIKKEDFIEKKIQLMNFGKSSYVPLDDPLNGTVLQKIQSARGENWFLVRTENPELENLLISFKDTSDNFMDYNSIILVRKVEGKIPDQLFIPGGYSFMGLYKMSPED